MCGKTITVSGGNIKSGNTTSCGCYFDEIKTKSKNLKDLTGQVFGRLTVLERYFNQEYPKTVYWTCSCSCGNVVHVSRPALYNKSTQSCGCLAKENNQLMWQDEEFVAKINQARYDKWYNTDRIRGENNPSWKGGVSSETHLIRESAKYKNWRKAVFWFDDYTCLISGKRGKELQAHHILNFSAYPELRTEPQNGVCVSKEMHKMFHDFYGIKNNTIEQVIEYYFLMNLYRL